MNFQTIPKVENADFFIDVAFREAKDASNRVRSTVRGTRLDKSKEIEIARLAASKQVIARLLSNILKTFPSFDNLNPFYTGLLKCYVDILEVKRGLGAAAWARGRVENIFLQTLGKVKRARDLEPINGYRREFYGRAASIIKQIDENLRYLEKTRHYMRKFPNIKEKYFTVAIAGFPNVGKSTLLSKLTSSTPEISEYAFTTKSLNLGYLEVDGVKIQLIDTPGTLNRFEKMNDIEKQAYLAIKHCAHLIIYVYDITEPYPLVDQKRLLEYVEKFEKPILFYLSKTDILPKAQQDEFRKKNPFLSVDELKKTIFKEAQPWLNKEKEAEAKEKELEESLEKASKQPYDSDWDEDEDKSDDDEE